MSAALGRAVGAFDSVYVSGRRVKFFAEGWDPDAMAHDEKLLETIKTSGTTSFQDIDDLVFDAHTRVATFRSPCAEWLPEESRTAHVMMVAPPESVPVRGVVLHLAATGEEGFAVRRDQVARPLARRGFVSLIPETPFYGLRRPTGQRAYFVASVGSFMLQVPATLVETAKLAKYARKVFPGVPIGLSGTSFGGAVAAAAYPSIVREFDALDEVEATRGGVGDASCSAPPPSRAHALALCTFVAPSQSKALMTGVFHRICHFHTLTKDEDGLRTRKQAKARLAEILQTRDLKPFFEILRDRPGAPVRTAYTCIRALHDRYVIPQESLLLYETLQPFMAHAERVDLAGGHVSSILQTSKVLPRAILRTFDALDALDPEVAQGSAPPPEPPISRYGSLLSYSRRRRQPVARAPQAAPPAAPAVPSEGSAPGCSEASTAVAAS